MNGRNAKRAADRRLGRVRPNATGAAAVTVVAATVAGVLLTAVIVVVLWPDEHPATLGFEQTAVIEIGGEKFTVEIASSYLQRVQGLMFRRHLPSHRGMFFIFATDKPRQFWMKNCLIPLDVAFIRSDGTIAAIHTMSVEPTGTREYRLYRSGGPVRFALELPAGTFARLGVGVGDKLNIPTSLLKHPADPDE